MRAGLMHYSAVGRLTKKYRNTGAEFLTRHVCNHAHRAPRGNVITLVRNRERKREGRVGGGGACECWPLLRNAEGF